MNFDQLTQNPCLAATVPAGVQETRTAVLRKEGIGPGTEIARVTEIAASAIEAVIEKVAVIETGATTATDVATAVGIEEGGIRVDTMTTQGSFHRCPFCLVSFPTIVSLGWYTCAD